MKKRRIKLTLIQKLLIAIIAGIIYGQMHFLPEIFFAIPVTISAFFSSILNFIIPLMVVAFVVTGIADLTEGAGKLLGYTTGIAYLSTIIGGTATILIVSRLFPHFINPDVVNIGELEAKIEPIFTIPLEPMLDVTGAIVFAFMMGLAMSWLRQNREDVGETIYAFFKDFSACIAFLLGHFVVPGIPIFVFGNFANLSYSGSVFSILSVFWKVYIIVLLLHFLYLVVWYGLAGAYTHKKPWQLLKNQVPGYMTAAATQSSAATIPVNLKIAKKNGVSEKIANFVIPFGATAHILGSVTTIVSIIYAVLLLNGLPTSISMFIPFIFTLGIAMVAAPGAPGGGIMSALPYIGMVGLDPSGATASLLISLYMTQDSFGTATNVSADNAMALVIDKLYNKYWSN
ncbi:cation:dicarboxylate symporter family transporter [Aerococcus kribbianus]|uniref:Cation:dicarboxylase symporter family transporter n=1 Tax=Aerococcus kribbianus TaxID=2999064 RepID=A0A9X3FP89_9LACT|nr:MULTISPECIES: cation:dicarboxylase symporter family transporter [unclassified Aerococcus]MCZ0718048.1 cation:dicarboxylase symporter family transporter [Aerococcus sp. YH-aer221]MCZ0726383.1 cation:dicarboxylase symporter family transporter [Aerococcus sp. YH-aer222]